MNQVFFLPHRSHVASLNPILPGDESVPRALQRDISGPVEVQLPDIFYRTKRERERNDWRLILTFMFKNCLNMFGYFVFGVFLDFVHIFHQPTPKHGTCCGENRENDDQQVD